MSPSTTARRFGRALPALGAVTPPALLACALLVEAFSKFKGAGNVRYGLMADGDSNTQFDDFLVTGP